MFFPFMFRLYRENRKTFKVCLAIFIIMQEMIYANQNCKFDFSCSAFFVSVTPSLITHNYHLSFEIPLN